VREFLSIRLRRAGHDRGRHERRAGARQLATAFDRRDDLRMPGGLTGRALDAIKSGKVACDCEVILVTAFATAETAIAAMKGATTT
jgi:DNA-binding NtrC family response regulator